MENDKVNEKMIKLQQNKIKLLEKDKVMQYMLESKNKLIKMHTKLLSHCIK